MLKIWAPRQEPAEIIRCRVFVTSNDLVTSALDHHREAVKAARRGYARDRDLDQALHASAERLVKTMWACRHAVKHLIVSIKADTLESSLFFQPAVLGLGSKACDAATKELLAMSRALVDNEGRDSRTAVTLLLILGLSTFVEKNAAEEERRNDAVQCVVDLTIRKSW